MADPAPKLSPRSDGAAHRRMLTVLAVAGFSAAISMRLCDAMLPELASVFAVPATDAAIVIWAFAITYGAMQMVYGRLGDRYGKPRVIAIAIGFCGLASLTAAAAPTLDMLAFARAAMGAGAAAVVPLAIAWIGDTVPLQQRQVVLARYSGATLSGIMLGAWAGGILTELVGWRAAFLFVAPLFFAVAIALLRLSGQVRAVLTPGTSHLPYTQQLVELLQIPWAQVVLGCALLEATFVFGFLAFLPTVLFTQFDMPLSHGGGVLAAFGLGGLVFSRLAPVLLRRVTPAVQARIGSMLLAAGYAMLVWLPHWSWAVAGCLVAGFGFYGLHNTMQLSATQLSTMSRGMGVSTFACFLFLGQSAGVVLAAQIFAHWGSACGFAIAGTALTLIGLGFAHQLHKREILLLHSP